MDWLSFIIKSLAVYRVSHMIAREDGPADILSKFRGNFEPTSNAGRGVNCPMCISFYLSFLIALPVENKVTKFITNALALSGITVLFMKFFR